MVRTRYWPAPRDPQLLAPPMPRRTVVNAMSRPKAEMTTMLRVAEDVYLQQLRGLGAWCGLGSTAPKPLFLVHYAPVRPRTWVGALQEPEARAAERRAAFRRG